MIINEPNLTQISIFLTNDCGYCSCRSEWIEIRRMIGSYRIISRFLHNIDWWAQIILQWMTSIDICYSSITQFLIIRRFQCIINIDQQSSLDHVNRGSRRINSFWYESIIFSWSFSRVKHSRINRREVMNRFFFVLDISVD